MPIEFDGPNSKVSANVIEAQSGSTITIQSGHNLSGGGSGLTALPAANLTGTIAAISGVNLTALNATQLTSGTIPIARIANDAIDSQHYAAGSIDLEHMSSQSVDEDNLHISNAGTNGQFLQKQSGNAGGLTWAAATTPLHYFNAYLSSDHTVGDGVTTVMTNWTEELDSDSWFSTSTGRWTPQTAGKYFIFGKGGISTNSASSIWHSAELFIRLNGTIKSGSVINFYNSYHGSEQSLNAALIINLNGSSDYVELGAYMNTSNGANGYFTGANWHRRTTFSGFYLGA